MDGNTADKTTLKEFLAKIEKQYGKAKRTWVMDRGIPTEEVLAEMRNSETPVHYLVGSPRGRLTQLEKAFLTKPWEDVRESVQVKLIVTHEGICRKFRVRAITMEKKETSYGETEATGYFRRAA